MDFNTNKLIGYDGKIALNLLCILDLIVYKIHASAIALIGQVFAVKIVLLLPVHCDFWMD